MSKTIMACSIEGCIHIAGVINFLTLAEDLGYQTRFLGPAIPINDLAKEIKRHNPEIVGISYRLSPENISDILDELQKTLEEQELLHNREFLFAGTPPVVRKGKQFSFFTKYFDGTEIIDDCIAYLKGESLNTYNEIGTTTTLKERVYRKYPYPLLRHHFGLPSLEETIEGVRTIAESKILDVISLSPDQNAQKAFFRPHEMNPFVNGAGGVRVRTADDFRRIYSSTKTGNYPLLRCYSGTQDLIKWAALLKDTLNNAWAAIPLCWYSLLDKRSPRPVLDAIKENLDAIRWHAKHNIPVEINEPHHWSLRDAPDAVAVAMAFLSAYNAKAAGVREYIAQLMLNTPPSTSAAMDLAKMLAKTELISSLENQDFRIYRQVRAGLTSFSVDLDIAKGQLASSTMLGLSLKPHIIHVVGFCEADHAATPIDIIESCKIARGVLRNCLHGLPAPSKDDRIIERKTRLINDANVILESLLFLGQELGSKDPYSDPQVISLAIKTGILDAPHLRGCPEACGALRTKIIDGACVTVDIRTGNALPEATRISKILDSHHVKRHLQQYRATAGLI